MKSDRKLKKSYWLGVFLPIHTMRLWYTTVHSEVSDELTGVFRTYCYICGPMESRNPAVRQLYTPQDEESFAIIVSCKWSLMGCLHVRFCALPSWNMCLTDESVEYKQQQIKTKRISCCRDCHEFIMYTWMTIATCKISRVNGPKRWRSYQHQVGTWFGPRFRQCGPSRTEFRQNLGQIRSAFASPHLRRSARKDWNESSSKVCAVRPVNSIYISGMLTPSHSLGQKVKPRWPTMEGQLAFQICKLSSLGPLWPQDGEVSKVRDSSEVSVVSSERTSV